MRKVNKIPVKLSRARGREWRTATHPRKYIHIPIQLYIILYTHDVRTGDKNNIKRKKGKRRYYEKISFVKITTDDDVVNRRISFQNVYTYVIYYYYRENQLAHGHRTELGAVFFSFKNIRYITIIIIIIYCPLLSSSVPHAISTRL